MRTKLKPPAYLKGPARAWWSAMVDAYSGFDVEPNARSLLDGAALQLMRAEQARKAIDRDGVAPLDRFGKPKEHPSLVTERAAMNLHRLLCREMGLQPAETEETRLPRLAGRYAS